MYSLEITLDDSKDKREYSVDLYLICPQLNVTEPDSFIYRYDNPSPAPYIHSINQVGKIIIRFNDTMIVPLEETEVLQIRTLDETKSAHNDKDLQ